MLMGIGELDYETDVQIDPTALDVAWLEQAELMGKYAGYAATAKKAVDDAKERLDVGKAEIEMQVRGDPERFGLSKVTEAGVQSTILLQPNYQQLVQTYNTEKYEYEVAMAAVRAIDQRKTALENLVKLLGVSYFAGPKAPRDLYQEQLQHTAQQRTDQKVRMQRRSKTRGGAE